ncbi:protein takeout-like isoform X1 [Lycorma delicatula]|uniref:protein takeout-like isoform X1 n=1 Tax=Lycorma delicatula TaxID=130591 RepID=UPI003F513837
MISIYTFLLIITFSFSNYVTSLKLPSYIKTCRKSDPKLNECVVKNGRLAIPHFLDGDVKYKTPRLDPLDISEVRVDQGSKRFGLSFLLKNCKLTGLKDAVFTAARVDLPKKHIEWDFFHPYITIIGNYKMSGKVLILPILGEGPANITLTNTKTVFEIDFDLVKKKDGFEYMKVRKTHLHTNVGGCIFKFENLFNGDKLLGENMNHFINDNWKEVMDQLGGPVVDAIGEVFKILLSNICELVPYDVVYPD